MDIIKIRSRKIGIGLLIFMLFIAYGLYLQMTPREYYVEMYEYGYTVEAVDDDIISQTINPILEPIFNYLGEGEPSQRNTLSGQVSHNILLSYQSDTTRIYVKNSGVVEHEFMIVDDKDMSLMMMKKMITDLRNQGLTDEEVKHKYHMMHHQMMEKYIAVGAYAELLPGETAVVEFNWNKPGIFWIVCHKYAGTYPELHQEHGMYTKIIVTNNDAFELFDEQWNEA